MTKAPGLYGRRFYPREVHDLIYRNGWKDPVTMSRMVATVSGESDRYEAAVGQVNSNGTQDWGMFQLNNGHWSDFASSPDAFYAICVDAEKAAPIARALFDKDKRAGGTGFGPWFAYGGKHYQEQLPECIKGIVNFLSEREGLGLIL
jgi:hypothetical protein